MAAPAKSTWLANVGSLPSSRQHWGLALANTQRVTGWDVSSAKSRLTHRDAVWGSAGMLQG